MKHRAFRPLLAIAAAVLVLAVGCDRPVDLSAVHDYAQTTADAEMSFAAIAADFEASCLRRHDVYLLLPVNLGRRELRYAQIALAPGYRAATAAPEPAVTPAAAPTGFSDDATCARASEIAREWADHDETILAYVRELGAVADVDAVPTFAPAPLGTPLVSTGVITAPQFDAFAQLASTVSQLVIAGDQRAEIAKLTTSANAPLHDATTALELVDAAYAQELRFEYGEIEGAYDVLIDQELQARSKTEPADQFLLSAQIAAQRTTERDALVAINAHRAATLAYAAVLDGILQTHQQLADATSRHAALADYAGIFKSTVVPLYADVRALKAAVK